MDVTDETGVFRIEDMHAWKQDGRCIGFFWVRHPDYPLTTREIAGIPQKADVTLQDPASVEGSVIDLVTGKPVAGARVNAQGIARDGWFQTTSEPDGSFELRMPEDHYNIWSELPARIPLAIKALSAESGKTVTGADVRMVRGGFVYGRVLNQDGQPAPQPSDHPNFVANHGPARPRTGAAVTSTRVQADGTYRLHVAPGRNYVYVMGGNQEFAWIAVGDGEEVEHDFIVGNSRQGGFTDGCEDLELRRRLIQEVQEKDEAQRKRKQ